MHKVTSASGATLGPTGHCDLTKFVDEEKGLLENVGYIAKSLRPWTTSVIIVPKCQTP